MDKRIRIFFFSIWIAILCVAVFYLNPHILSAEIGDSRRQFNKDPIVSHPILIEEAQVHADEAMPESIYRGGSRRTGIYAQDLPYSMLRRTWRIDPFNHELHQASKSTPVTDGKRLYVGDDFGRMNAIDLDGRKLWSYQSYSDRGVHGSALVVNDSVFWGDYEGILYAANKENGSLQWMIDLGDTIGSSPLYFKKDIYIAVETFRRPNGFVAKLDARNGKIKWLSPFLGAQAHSSPTLSEDEKTVYVGANNGYLNALDANTGKLLWIYKTGDAIKGTPAVLHGGIYFCSWDGFLYKLNAVGTLLWRSPLGSGCQSSATFSEKSGNVFVVTKGGEILALNLESGKKEWSYKGDGQLISSGVLIQNRKKEEALIVPCHSEKVCVFEPASGKIITMLKTETMVTSVPMIFDRTVFLSMDGRGGLGRWK